MNCLIVVNIAILLLRFAGANPIGDFNANATMMISSGDDASNVSSSDHPYCWNPPINSPSIPDLIFGLDKELSDVIDVLEPACPNITFKRNVSS